MQKKVWAAGAKPVPACIGAHFASPVSLWVGVTVVKGGL